MGRTRGTPQTSEMLGPRDPRWRRDFQTRSRATSVGAGLGLDEQRRAALTPDMRSVLMPEGDVRTGGGLRKHKGKLEIRVGRGLAMDADGALTAAAAKAVTPLPDNTTGSAGVALDDSGASYSRATLNNNFATMKAHIDELRHALEGVGLINKGTD